MAQNNTSDVPLVVETANEFAAMRSYAGDLKPSSRSSLLTERLVLTAYAL